MSTYIKTIFQRTAKPRGKDLHGLGGSTVVNKSSSTVTVGHSHSNLEVLDSIDQLSLDKWDNALPAPSGGSVGMVLKKAASGPVWANEGVMKHSIPCRIMPETGVFDIDTSLGTILGYIQLGHTVVLDIARVRSNPFELVLLDYLIGSQGQESWAEFGLVIDRTEYYVKGSNAGASGAEDVWQYTPTLLQTQLVSGTNIKTINNQSLLGSGNITISGGSSDLIVEFTLNGESVVSNKTVSEIVTAYNAGRNVKGQVSISSTIYQLVSASTNGANSSVVFISSDDSVCSQITGSNAGSGDSWNIENLLIASDAIRYSEQELTEEQQMQARSNQDLYYQKDEYGKYVSFHNRYETEVMFD